MENTDCSVAGAAQVMERFLAVFSHWILTLLSLKCKRPPRLGRVFSKRQTWMVVTARITSVGLRLGKH